MTGCRRSVGWGGVRDGSQATGVGTRWVGGAAHGEGDHGKRDMF